MKNNTPSINSERRGFLGALTILGSTLASLVPELRANTILGGSAGVTLTPLSPSQVAILHSQALSDFDISLLVKKIGNQSSLSTPIYSYEMRSNGKVIKIPIIDAASRTTVAHLFYGAMKNTNSDGTQISVPVKIAVQPDGEVIAANSGKMYRLVTDEQLDIKNQLKVAVWAKEEKLRQIERADFNQQLAVRPKCLVEYEDCLVAAETLEIEALTWTLGAIACMVLTAKGAAVTLGAGAKLAAVCAFTTLAGGFGSASGATAIRRSCYEKFYQCLGLLVPRTQPLVPRPSDLSVQEIQVSIQLE